MGPQEIDLHVETLQVTLGILFSRRLHLALRYLALALGNIGRIPGTPHIQGPKKGNLAFGTTTFFLSFFLSFWSVDRDILTPESPESPAACESRPEF